MRLRRLTLARYGRFQDFALDFGDATAGQPDLHLIYGPNEAGKSTIHDAYLDLLFGMPRISPYAFLHDSNTLRIEAEFQLGDAAEAVARIKRNKDDLLDRAGRPFATPAFRQALGRLDRAGYAQMFSLNDETLKAGGESLIGAEGDFGSLLYGATSGVAELGARLKALSKAADEIHRKHARAPTEVRTLKARLADIDKEKREIDVSASHYARLAKDRASAADAKTAADAALRDAREALERLKTEALALPKLKVLADVEDRLSPTADLPDAPPDADERLERLAEAQTKLAARRDALAKTQAGLEAEAAQLPEPDPILTHAEALEDEAFQMLTHRSYSNKLDLPNRIEELAGLDAEIAATRSTLGLDEGDAAQATDAQLAELDRLLAALPELTTRLQTAEEELAAAETRLEGAEAADDATLARLESALADADAFNADRLDDLAGAAKAAATAEELALARLAPWVGDADALLALTAPPPAKRDAWQAAADRQAEALAANEDAQAREAEALRAAEADAAAVEIDAPDDAAFKDLLAARDAAWSAHRAALTQETADAFAGLLAETDRAGEARLSAADALATQRAVLLRGLNAKSKLEALARDAERLEAEASKLGQQVSGAAKSLGLPAETDLDALQAWMASRDDALGAIETARQAAAAYQAAKDAAATRAKALADALAAAGAENGADLSLSALRQLGRTTLDRLKRLGEARQALDGRKRGRQTAKQAMERWQAAWTTATEATWLEGQTPEAARARLQPYRDLMREISGREDLARRIASMQADIAGFQRRIDDVVAALDDAPASEDAASIARALQARLTAARQLEAKRADLAKRIAEAQAALDEADIEANALGSERAAFLKLLDAADLEAARARLKAIAVRERLLEDRSRLQADIAAAARTGETFAGLRTRLADLDAASHAASLQAAEDTLADAEARRESAVAADALAGKALDDLGGDNRAAALEQARQTVLAELEDAAERHLKLKLGVMAAERALDAYRDLRRSGMLDRASETFRRLTGGSFKGLATQADGTREILIAERGLDAKGLIDKDMSVGTRAQLYLALRVAGYHEVAQQGQPPPFIADDILETFDDGRSEAAFAALAEMAGHGQVIYLTHHAHLIPLAETAAPGLKVHRLPNPV